MGFVFRRTHYSEGAHTLPMVLDVGFEKRYPLFFLPFECIILSFFIYLGASFWV